MPSHVIDETQCDTCMVKSLSRFWAGRCVSRSENSETKLQSIVTPSHIPSVEDSGLGRLSMTRWSLTVFPILLTHHLPKEGEFLGVNIQYTCAESRAKIGKYALKNDNERARLHFRAPAVSQSKRKHHQKLQKGLQGATEKESSSHSTSNYA